MEIKYEEFICFKITIMGSAATGKTAICNRLVNNYFPTIYDPTIDVENFTFLFNLSELGMVKKIHVMVTLEDMFGLNNPLLQTMDNLIKSEEQKERKRVMTDIFKNIMFTSSDKRKKLSDESKKSKNDSSNNNKQDKYFIYDKIFNDDVENQFERKGFVFVCDCNDTSSIEDLSTIIEKLHQIEKTNNLIYPKLILVNKIDKANKETLVSVKQKVDQMKKKFGCDSSQISALTNSNIIETFKMFLSKIHQNENDSRHKDYEDQEHIGDDDYSKNVT